jgi:DNA (cytosine-5)-methyltransferase 3A
MHKRVFNPAFKCHTLTAVGGGGQQKKVLVGGRVRQLTPTEYERLLTLPDGYTAGVADGPRWRALGNGWTAEIIIHILSYALRDVPRDEEIVVLSMYDGIATGRYCLDKMGFKNVTYYAYEIDPKPIEIAKRNWPDIIHLGDAFDVRSPGWCLPGEEDDSWML